MVTVSDRIYQIGSIIIQLPLKMESEIMKVVDFALDQPNVSGYICVNNDGLCIASGGDASESISGIIHQLANLAYKIEDHSQHDGSSNKKDPPVVRIDLERRKILIQSREGITTALFSHQK
uniref:Late endosomal/lysosomal adaptor and MAPK and MTOR activator 5 n=1 Tax=Aceria tosichella TaxID=561515 RepID=A0A6G1S4T3_9ACAR